MKGITKVRHPGLGTSSRDSGLGTRDSGLGNRDSGLGTQNSEFPNFLPGNELKNEGTLYTLFL